MSQTLSLFGLPLLNTDRTTAVRHLLGRRGKTTAAFLNAHCVNTAAKDPQYQRALRAADVVLPDGAGISLAAKLTGRKLRENLNGTDLCLPLCREAAARGLSIYLLGAAPGVAAEAANNLIRKVPGLRVSGTQDGFFDQETSDAVIAKINASSADIVMVAMGVPLQDVWLYQRRKSINAQLVMGVGALFDFTAGRVARAYQDAEARRAHLLEQSERDGVCFKMRADPRITRVGRFIRRYSIDELPQLLNVLRGDMSLVGPRPALPSEVALYPTGALRRLHAVPGITGIWQVSGRAEIGFTRMVAMDVTYLRSKSFGLDLLLLGLTARAVFSGRGAY